MACGVYKQEGYREYRKRRSNWTLTVQPANICDTFLDYAQTTPEPEIRCNRYDFWILSNVTSSLPKDGGFLNASLQSLGVIGSVTYGSLPREVYQTDMNGTYFKLNVNCTTSVPQRRSKFRFLVTLAGSLETLSSAQKIALKVSIMRRVVAASGGSITWDDIVEVVLTSGSINAEVILDENVPQETATIAASTFDTIDTSPLSIGGNGTLAVQSVGNPVTVGPSTLPGSTIATTEEPSCCDTAATVQSCVMVLLALLVGTFVL